MHSLHFTAESSSNGIVERDFTVGEVPGVLWSPASGPRSRAPGADGARWRPAQEDTGPRWPAPTTLVTTCGFTVAAIDAPGHGDRPRTADDEQARAEFRQAMAAGDPERSESISVRYVTSLAERAVPEWQATLDALQELPEIGTDAPIGYGGGISLGTAIGVPLMAIEPRITAAIFGGVLRARGPDRGGETDHRPDPVPAPVGRRARRPRESALALFDAFASKEKTLHANPGNHRNCRWFEVDSEFLPRHLGQRSRRRPDLTGFGVRLLSRTPIPLSHLVCRGSRHARTSTVPRFHCCWHEGCLARSRRRDGVTRAASR